MTTPYAVDSGSPGYAYRIDWGPWIALPLRIGSMDRAREFVERRLSGREDARSVRVTISGGNRALQFRWPLVENRGEQ